MKRFFKRTRNRMEATKEGALLGAIAQMARLRITDLAVSSELSVTSFT
jgi:hypothetical protein